MRGDMAKVLVERPRRGGRDRGESRYRYDGDETSRAAEQLPKTQSMLAAHVDRKSFDDHLGPLWKFLGRRVGRRWDDVYGEIRAVVKGRSTVLLHVLSHVDGMVAKDCVFDERGRPTASTRHGRWWSLFPGSFYVDQRGFLRRTPFVKRPRHDWRLGRRYEKVLEIVNRCVGDKARIEQAGSTLQRVNRDARGEWTVRKEATAAHAEGDAPWVERYGYARAVVWHLERTGCTDAYMRRLLERLRAALPKGPAKGGGR
jgi:hypothetical protein